LTSEGFGDGSGFVPNPKKLKLAVADERRSGMRRI
jgi:hypothetical protein